MIVDRPKPSKKVREGIENAQLILVTSQEIDELCEQDNITQARRQMDGVLNDLRRGVRMLVDMGIERIVLAADHGHLFADELSEDMKVDSPVTQLEAAATRGNLPVVLLDSATGGGKQHHNHSRLAQRVIRWHRMGLGEQEIARNVAEGAE